MARLTIRTIWDSCFTGAGDVGLEITTNHDLIHLMIECGNFVPEVNIGDHYTFIDKKGVKTFPYDVKTLSELGLCNGDEVKKNIV